MPVSVSDACARIIAAPAPLLILDACAILDIIRAPARGKVPPDLLGVAIKLNAAAANTPPDVWLVAAEEIPSEYADNRQSAIADIEQHIRQTEKLIGGLNAAMAAGGLPVTVPHGAYSSGTLVQRAADTCDAMMDSAIVLESADAFERGSQRAYRRIAPGRKGGEIKDCIIFEQVLGLIRTLRSGGFGLRIVFASSNTRDYYENGALHPDVARDLSPLDVEFVTDICWASSILGL